MKTALVTGAARRIGAAITRDLHQQGYNVVIHYRSSAQDAKKLANELNQIRAQSAQIMQFDLNKIDRFPKLVQDVIDIWGRLDVLVNNASSFFPTRFGDVEENQWEELFSSNLKGPFFLSQAASTALKQSHGSIINITDFHANIPMKGYPVYCMAKAGLVMMTKSLARELAPEVRVNAVAPGQMVWPEGVNAYDDDKKQRIIAKTALKRIGTAQNISKAVLFLIENDYLTGQNIPVDGGRILNA
jgi:pteridine reductase